MKDNLAVLSISFGIFGAILLMMGFFMDKENQLSFEESTLWINPLFIMGVVLIIMAFLCLIVASILSIRERVVTVRVARANLMSPSSHQSRWPLPTYGGCVSR